MASCQAIMEKRHTSVRTDDDSGFDTLWLLKKMDSRSEKNKQGANETWRHQGAAPPQAHSRWRLVQPRALAS